jgi:formylglycine-generating enzyme
MVFFMIPFITFWSLMILASAASAAEIQRFSLEQDGQQRIIHYDLVGEEREASVVLTVVVQGKHYADKDLHLSGDIGIVRTGKDKSICWSVLQDFPNGTGGPVETRLSVAWAVFKDRKTDMEFVTMKGGCFQAGDLFGDGSANEKPLHEVCVSDFAIGRYEVKVREFRQFVNDTDYRTEAERKDGCYSWCEKGWKKDRSKNWSNPGFEQEDDHPVVCVSWNDAAKFAAWLSRKSGRTYRLPTEAEWEYAARSLGKEVKYAWGNGGPVGNIADEFSKRQCPLLATWPGYDDGYVYTAPVGKYQPNDAGLYDMAGNVSEWCQDWYDVHYYTDSPRKDPHGPFDGQYKALRGGSWSSAPDRQRIASRMGNEPHKGYANLGFRLVAADTPKGGSDNKER